MKKFKHSLDFQRREGKEWNQPATPAMVSGLNLEGELILFPNQHPKEPCLGIEQLN